MKAYGYGYGIPFAKRRGGIKAPSNLAVEDITGGVRLTWTDNSSDEDGFEIYVSIDDAAFVLLASVDADVETYDDLTDYRGSTVDYKVRAYKGTKFSAFSDEAEIEVDPDILSLATTWVDDFARITFDGIDSWQTEIHESKDGVNYTLAATIDAGTETYDNYTWQGTTVYFKARAKNGDEYGDFTTPITIATPLVFKYDNNPTATFSMGGLGLPAGKTVRMSRGTFHPTTGVERYTDYTLNTAPGTSWPEDNEKNLDPVYIKFSGDLNSITTFSLIDKTLCYGDISKWVLPTGLTVFNIKGCNFTGDLSGWALTSATGVDFRIYDNLFTGDLSTMLINTNGDTILWIGNTDGKNEFTAPPRGDLKHVGTGGGAGLYMRHCNVSTANIDAWLAWANNYFASNTPVRNSIFYLAGTGMGAPTGGNNNADRLGIIAKYTAAGFTATVTTAT